MSGHTPGPWVIFYADKDGANDILPAGRLGCIARDILSIEDARLIAAAPLMYNFVLNAHMLGDEKATEIIEQIHGTAKS